MEPEEFSSLVKRTIVEGNTRTYKALLAGDPSKSTDELWRSLQTLYARLSATEREVLLGGMRQASVDACSGLLGALDNATTLKGLQGELAVLLDGDQINGDLQDFFLAAMEDE